MFNKLYKKYSNAVDRGKPYHCMLMLLIFFIITAIVGVQSLKRGFTADDYFLRTNLDGFVYSMLEGNAYDKFFVESEVLAKYTDINFDLRNHTISVFIDLRPVASAWYWFIRWLLTPQGDVYLYRLVTILQYLLAGFCAYIFFRDIFDHIYPALVATAIFHFSTWREQTFHFVGLSFSSGFATLLFCAGIMAFKKFLILYSKQMHTIETVSWIRLIFWYLFSLFMAALGTFSYAVYGLLFLGSTFLLFIFEDTIYHQKPLLSIKKTQRMVIFLPYIVMVVIYFLAWVQINNIYLLKYKYLMPILNLEGMSFSASKVITGYICGLLYYIPIPLYLLNEAILLYFQYIIPLLFVGILFAAIWIFMRWKTWLIEHKERYLFILFIVLVILNLLPLTLAPLPRIAIGSPLIFAVFLTILTRNIRFGNLLLAIYMIVSIFSFLQISSDWGKIDRIKNSGLNEINRKVEDHKKYVSFANIEQIGTYPIFNLEGTTFEQAVRAPEVTPEGKEVYIRVPFFYYFYSFDDFKKGEIKIEPFKAESGNPAFLIRIDGCNCGIKIRNLKQGADEIDFSFAHLKVVEWKPKLNKYQTITFAKTVAVEIKSGFEPLIIPMEKLKTAL